jgi:hypothetical protein
MSTIKLRTSEECLKFDLGLPTSGSGEDRADQLELSVCLAVQLRPQHAIHASHRSWCHQSCQLHCCIFQSLRLRYVVDDTILERFSASVFVCFE